MYQAAAISTRYAFIRHAISFISFSLSPAFHDVRPVAARFSSTPPSTFCRRLRQFRPPPPAESEEKIEKEVMQRRSRFEQKKAPTQG